MCRTPHEDVGNKTLEPLCALNQSFVFSAMQNKNPYGLGKIPAQCWDAILNVHD